MARGRPAWRGARRSDAKPALPARGQAPDAQAAQEAWPCAACVDHEKAKSYAAANRGLGLKGEHRQHKGLNNRAENSHRPTRVREEVIRRFKSSRHVQRFASVHDQVANLFMHCRYHTDAKEKRALRTQTFEAWESVTCAPMLDRVNFSVSYPHVLRVRPHTGQQVDNTRNPAGGIP